MIMLIMKSRIQYINGKISCFKTRSLDGEYKRNENDGCFSRKKQIVLEGGELITLRSTPGKIPETNPRASKFPINL